MIECVYWHFSFFTHVFPFLLKLQKFQHTCCVHLRKNPYLAAFPKPAVPSLDVWLFLAKIRCCIQPILFHTFAFLVLLYLQPCLQMARLIFFTFDLWRLKRKILLVLALLEPYIFVAFLRQAHRTHYNKKSSHKTSKK